MSFGFSIPRESWSKQGKEQKYFLGWHIWFLTVLLYTSITEVWQTRSWRKEKQLVGSVERGESEGGDCSCTGLRDLLDKKNKMMSCTACSAVAGDQSLLAHFLGMPFHWPKAAASSKSPWVGLHRTKAGSHLQRNSQCIFWSKNSRTETAFDLGYGIHFI